MKSCGYLTLTKDGKKASVVVKHVRYHLNRDEALAVLKGEKNYTLIFDFEDGGEKNE